MLANSYVPVYLFLGPAAAFLSFVLAVAVETPALKALWRRPFWSTVRWVLFANLLSAIFGVGPITCGRALSQISFSSDPFALYQSYWTNQLLLAGLLLGATLAIEFLTCFFLNRRRAGLPVRKLGAGILTANLASYAILLTYAFTNLHPTGESAFTFEPDARWVQADETRVWYVDPRDHLCSIRLDGTDARIEVNDRLSRTRGPWPGERFYALLPARQAVLYGDAEYVWHLQHRGENARLATSLPEGWQHSISRDQGGPTIEKVLAVAMTALGLSATTQPSEPVYFYVPEWHFWSDTIDSGYLRVKGSSWRPDGSGVGLRVKHEDGKEDEFMVSNGLATLGCFEPAIVQDKGLIVFRCGGWILIMDPKARRVGRLVQGDSMLLETPAFGLPSQPATRNSLADEG